MANNRRNITHKLILTVFIIYLSISNVFASTPEIEIDHNDNEYFHAYNSNTNVPNSYIDSGPAVFSKAMNYMFMNIAKSTSSVFAIKGVADNMYSKLSSSDTTLNNIATDINLIKQSNISQVSSLSSLLSNSNSTLTYLSQVSSTIGGSTSGNLVDIKNDLKYINWVTIPDSFIGWFDSDGNEITSNYGSARRGFITARFNTTNIQNTDTYLLKLGIEGYYQPDKLNFIKDIKIYTTSDGSQLPIDVEWDYFRGSTGVTLLTRIPNSYNIDVVIETQRDFFLYQNGSGMSYLNRNTTDSYTVENNYYLKTLANKDFTANISGDVNIDTSDIENKIDDVIEAIDNVSLVDNSVKLNLTINNNTGSDGTNIITRLQNFFDTGVSVSDFFDNVDDAESGWFTQSNSDVINTLRGGYTNFYE